MVPTPRELPASPLTPLFSMPLTPGSFLTQGFWACCPSSSSSCQAEGRVETTQSASAHTAVSVYSLLTLE